MLLYQHVRERGVPAEALHGQDGVAWNCETKGKSADWLGSCFLPASPYELREGSPTDADVVPSQSPSLAILYGTEPPLRKVVHRAGALVTYRTEITRFGLSCYRCSVDPTFLGPPRASVLAHLS